MVMMLFGILMALKYWDIVLLSNGPREEEEDLLVMNVISVSDVAVKVTGLVTAIMPLPVIVDHHHDQDHPEEGTQDHPKEDLIDRPDVLIDHVINLVQDQDLLLDLQENILAMKLMPRDLLPDHLADPDHVQDQDHLRPLLIKTVHAPDQEVQTKLLTVIQMT